MTLIALDGFATHATRPLPSLAQQHLDAFAREEDYACVTLRVAGQERDYLAVRGCSGCATDRCVVGCRASLLRRALTSALSGLSTRVLRHPLRTQPYQQGILAWPLRNAVPLDRSILWEREALALHLGIHREGAGIRTMALFAVGADDDAATRSLLANVRERGWRVALLPRLLQPTVVKLLHSPPRIYGTRAGWGAHLLTAPSEESAPARAAGAAMSTASGREEGSRVQQ